MLLLFPGSLNGILVPGDRDGLTSLTGKGFFCIGVPGFSLGLAGWIGFGSCGCSFGLFGIPYKIPIKIKTRLTRKVHKAAS